MMPTLTILEGDALVQLRTLPAESVHCCVTSPPYWGLRDYGIPPQVWDGGPDCAHEFADETISTEIGKGNWAQGVNGRGEAQPGGVAAKRGFCIRCGAWRGSLGLEPTPALYVAHVVEVFREVRRVLREDGTCWLNLGDSYAGSWGAQSRRESSTNATAISRNHIVNHPKPKRASHTGSIREEGLKPKDLIGIPWRVAFALQADGWWLRSEIIWHKPNSMPESVTDRPTKVHEQIFLLTKAERYYYDAEAILEPCSEDTNPRRAGNGWKTPDGWDTSSGEGGHGSFHKNGREKGHTGYLPHGSIAARIARAKTSHKSAPDEMRNGIRARKLAETGSGVKNNESFDAAMAIMPERRNKRTVWTVPTSRYSEAHFATFPPALIAPCILAGCPVGGTVLDPFFGSGTTGMVALELGRSAIGVELNPAYIALARQRCAITPGLALEGIA